MQKSGDLTNGKVEVKTNFLFGSTVEFSCLEGKYKAIQKQDFSFQLMYIMHSCVSKMEWCKKVFIENSHFHTTYSSLSVTNLDS